MDFSKEHRIKAGDKVDLLAIPTKFKGPFKGKDEAREFTEEITDELRHMQYRMFVEGKDLKSTCNSCGKLNSHNSMDKAGKAFINHLK